MVLRRVGWRVVTLAAASIAAASATLSVPFAQTLATGSVAPQGNLVWGGPVPPAPVPGQATVYVPSAAYSSERVDPIPGQSAFRGPAPAPEQFLAPAVMPPPDPAATAAPPQPERGPGDYGRTYPVQETPPVRQAALPPLDAPRVIDDGGPAGLYGSVPEENFDPWEGLTDVTPGTVPPPDLTPVPQPTAAIPSYAALERSAPRPAPEKERGGWGWNPFNWGRGSLSDKAPSGYRALPKGEAQCRRQLQKLGVQFTDVSSVGNGGRCGIQNPVRVTMAAKGIAMQPAATLSCQTALQTARWLDDDVRSAARWRLWKKPTAVLNASSYRCSRIAGSRTISEHALGNALDIRGFAFSDGSKMLIEPKGFWKRGERKFQHQVRTAGCRYFGTVLGPGYNRAHADHLHFDVKSRMRPVCK